MERKRDLPKNSKFLARALVAAIVSAVVLGIWQGGLHWSLLRCEKYLQSATLPDGIEAKAVGKFADAFASERGVKYLVNVMEKGSIKKSESAVLCLMSIEENLGLLELSDDEFEKCVALIYDSSFRDKIGSLATSGSTPAIRAVFQARLDRRRRVETLFRGRGV